MKDYPYVPGWRLNKENNKPAIKHSVLMLTTHGVAEGEWDGNEWVQYRWSCKVKDSDVLYWIHLEDLTQLEKEGDSLQQEQLDKYETALEKAREWMPNVNQGGHVILIDIFPELGEGLDPRYGGRKQKQPEVDLDAEIDRFLYGIKFKRDCYGIHIPGECMRDWKGKKYINRDVTPEDMRKFARHFYELGKTARKEE